jgi:glutaconate CoA-transferase subunit B
MTITTNNMSFPRIEGVDGTTATLMVCVVARELRDDQVVAFGLNADAMLSAAMLAQRLHAPNLCIRHGLRAERGMVFGAAAWTDRRNDESWQQVEYLETHDAILRVANPNSPMRFCDVFFVGGMQIDQEGSTNLIGLRGGDGQLALRGPGSIGTTSIGTLANNVILFSPEHTPRRFVETVDFVSVPGWKRRAAAGLKGGPHLCVTSKAVMDFNDKRMRLRSVHPGLDVDEVVASTGFPLLLPNTIPTTALPSNAELQALSDLACSGSNSRGTRP